MSALVAGVPRPLPRFALRASSSTKRPACSMAERSVASVYLSGGVVTFFLIFTDESVTSSPSFICIRMKLFSLSSVSIEAVFRPALSDTER